MGTIIKNKRQKNKKFGCLVIIISIVTVIISFNIFPKFQRPSFGNISPQISKISEIYEKLYEVLERVDIEKADLYAAIKKEDFDLNWKTQQADILYDSIPEGEIIKKGLGSGSLAPVGKYKKVVKLREQIAKDRIKWQSEKNRIVKERGPLVDNEEVKALWAQRLPFVKDIDEYEGRIEEYNKSPKGRLNNFISGFFIILGVLGILGAMTGFAGITD
ncbi:MAG: hypothetical protein A2Y03_00385 [Omnitrophica WOR_2 bacterium GWF2_38_59]|nr:MAG: hypothetical protein A2Y06_06475 [Omnitrophica WOR_2 bacterium GWA2_37_7]OGX26601.1 MAG: hypothetical protein A2Y03_00385 [Omnitrophica WOR_2 bacterium GWF2_38_59]OGX47726.1 MAG: hypothetical protein A2243_00275 [Omnitrophica WOR_2 bacterium RIFOXYA2_FULL_38_17]OGX55765.1 MAG: hypothetical protein A2306_10965 [Omnitrophica WOR_2 bacterium RIFOXYB2_FULL_38_16]OGX57742.1 MAG: hypothetical protein A2447_06570 [Omnitrophica WOR_2 bacterium RIFOXYC2_FULL_38_12]HBG60394.1 hypothetical protei